MMLRELLANPRRRDDEWMDRDTVNADELRRALGFIRRINALLGYTRSIVGHFNRISRGWRPGERVTVLDLATGSADIPLALLGWAARRGFDLRIVAVDRHPVTAAAARSAAGDDPRLRIVRADVFALPFEPGSFDYVMTAMFLHHLSEGEIAQVLSTMARLARRGVVAADLLRHRRAIAWIRLLTLGQSAMIRHDALTSVRQSLTQDEIVSLARQAGWNDRFDVRYTRHFGHRFVLSALVRDASGPAQTRPEQ